VIVVTLPIRIVSEANLREHFRTVAARKKIHRQTACVLMQRHLRPIPERRATITLTRIAPRVLDDDNLAGGFKACRDGVADWLGIDDGSPMLTWRYAQRKGKRGEYAAEVQVEWGEACPT
jgi:hypothetical protein